MIYLLLYIGETLDLPAPKRLQRRAWRVWYNKAPHAIGWSKRHYVFHDWRYAFSFSNVKDVRRTINSLLGSMAKDTSCVVDFSWHSPGSAEYVAMLDRSMAEKDHAAELIETGYKSNLEKANSIRELTAGAQSVQKHRFMNYRQYVGANS